MITRFALPITRWHRRYGGLILAALAVAAAGCLKIKSDPVEVKPIHITMDVNVNVKVDRQLDNFFGDVDAARQTDTKADTTPTATPAPEETKQP